MRVFMPDQAEWNDMCPLPKVVGALFGTYFASLNGCACAMMSAFAKQDLLSGGISCCKGWSGVRANNATKMPCVPVRACGTYCFGVATDVLVAAFCFALAAVFGPLLAGVLSQARRPPAICVDVDPCSALQPYAAGTSKPRSVYRSPTRRAISSKSACDSKPSSCRSSSSDEKSTGHASSEVYARRSTGSDVALRSSLDAMRALRTRKTRPFSVLLLPLPLLLLLASLALSMAVGNRQPAL